MNSPLFVLDGFGLIFRSYFAFIRNPIRNAEGKNISALMGFFRTVLNMLQKYGAKNIMIAFDSPGKTFRDDLYPEYKQNRDETPEELKEQIPRIMEILDDLNLARINVPGFEADDIMAYFAKYCRENNKECYLVTSDKDMMQLVDDRVKMLKPDKAGFIKMGPSEVFESKGVNPNQILDYLSLLGDSADNVPGVRGIGEKTASKLLAEYGTLDGIYENIEAITAKAQKEKLIIGKELAYLSKKLITLNPQMDISFKEEDFDAGKLNCGKAAQSMKALGLRSLSNDYMLHAGLDPYAQNGAETKEMPQEPGEKKIEKEELNKESDANAPTGLPMPQDDPRFSEYRKIKGQYELVTSAEKLKEILNEAKKSQFIAFDTETNSLDSLQANLAGFSLSYTLGKAYYVAIRGPEGDVLSMDEIGPLLRDFFSDPEVKIIGHNIKYDAKVMHQHGINIANIYFDTLVAAWLIDTTSNAYSMDKVAQNYLHYETIHFADVTGQKTKNEVVDFARVELDKAKDYAAEDADITYRLFKVFEQVIKDRSYEKLFYELEMPLIPILTRMELEGIKVDVPKLEAYSKVLEEELGAIQKKVYELCGKEFNIASTKQLQEVLFVDRKLKPIKKTKTGFSTDNSVLEELAKEDPVPQQILRYRVLAKLKSTYVDSLPMIVNPNTRRIHTHFLLNGTATGRISSKDPNLQNIPIRDEEGRKIREAFVPKEGCRFVSADYSQIELVVLANLSGDQGLSKAFKEGTDVHRATAALIFETDPDQVNPSQRRIAKTINFGVMYGMSAFRLSRELQIPRKQATEFIERYFATYSGIQSFITDMSEKAKKEGGVYTYAGRYRSIPTITSSNKTEQAAAARIAVNTPIQGTAADIVKLAMLNIDSEIRKRNLSSKMLLQVHDELILECPDHEVEEVSNLLRDIMPKAVKLDPALSVNVEVGDSWGTIH